MNHHANARFWREKSRLKKARHRRLPQARRVARNKHKKFAALRAGRSKTQEKRPMRNSLTADLVTADENCIAP
jgi:hypothetical protein